MESKLSSTGRFLVLYVVPTCFLLVSAVAPLIFGQGTLYHRDVLSSHFPLKAAQAQLMAEGELPLVDPYRSAGQPLVGNLNAVPLYPDNILYLVASPLWSLNAHFWIHLLLAPIAFYWLGRRWRLSPAAAWAAGICYATCGFFFSLFNLYNLIAGAALVPAFVAAALTLAERPSKRWPWAAVAGLWALLILAGDPLFALLGGLLAWTAVMAHGRATVGAAPDGPPTVEGGRSSSRRFGALRRSWPLLPAVAVGSLLAAPQWVELLRILPLSFRGYWQYSPQAALSQSWDPRTMLEWFLPFVFGAPDFSFWGESFFGGNPPLLYSLYPGLLCWILLAASGRPKGPRGWWPWWMIGGGIFLASGIHNPLMVWLYQIPGAAVMRYPVKMWLLVAMGGALLCGIGFDRLLDGSGRRRAAIMAATLTLALAGLWITLMILPSGLETWLRQLESRQLVEPIFSWELAKWRGTSLVSVLQLGLMGLALLLMRRRAFLGGALLLAVHVALQTFFLATLIDADDIEPYTARPALLSHLPEDARIVHGGFHELFGPTVGSPMKLFPDPRVFWLSRSHFTELHPFSGIQWDRRYGFNNSPEGLDSFYSVSMVLAMPRMPDDARVRLLRASGIDRLLLPRALEGVDDDEAQLLATFPSAGHDLRVYELRNTLPDVLLTYDVRRAPHMDSALDQLTAVDFDPAASAVLPGEEIDGRGADDGAVLEDAAVGTAQVLEHTTERLEVATRSQRDGLLVTRRAFLPIYRASVDGQEVDTHVANAHRLAVAVPKGEHRVHLWVDRRPFHAALATAAITLLGLLIFLWRGANTSQGTPSA